MKRFLISVAMIMICFVVPIKADAITDVGVINAPTMLELSGTLVNSETANIKIKDGKISAQYLFRLNNQGAKRSTVVIAIPRANETSLNLKLNNVIMSRIKAEKAELQGEYPNSKLPKYNSFNLWRLELNSNSSSSVEINFEGKYIKGKKLTFAIGEEQNNSEMYQGNCKVNFETQKLFSSDIGELFIGDAQLANATTNATGKASWSGTGKLPKILLKYKNTREELVSVLLKSRYKYPRNIGAALLKNDYKSVGKLGNVYLTIKATQDPRLNIGYIKYAMAEAAYMNEDEISFEKYLSEIDYLQLGSDQLSTRMAVRALEYSKKTSSNTTGVSTLEAFKTAKSKEYERVRLVLESEGIINKQGSFLAGSAAITDTPTLSPTPNSSTAGKKDDGKVKTGKEGNGFFKMVSGLFLKIKEKGIFGLLVAFVLGIAVGFYLARRKYRGTNRKSRTVYIG